MSNEHIFLPDVKAFLDAVDKVLNSRTFLLKINISFDNWQTQITDYLMSMQFDEAVVNQLAARDNEVLVDKNICFYKKNQPRFEAIAAAKAYCYTMLIGNLNRNKKIKIPFLGYSFYSPYLKMLPENEARNIVNSFFKTLFASEQLLATWAISPDFIRSKSQARAEGNGEFFTYFYGEDGIPMDSATLFIGSKTAYLLLTNGND